MSATLPALDPEFDEIVRRQRESLLRACEGSIAEALATDDVTEVIVDPSGAVFFDRLYGTLERQSKPMEPRAVKRIIRGIAGLLEKDVVDGLLEGEVPGDGSRVQGWLPPIVTAPALAIRKHRRQGVDGWPALTIADYSMPDAYRDAIAQMVERRANVLIVGSTGSGKTTFGGAFLNSISKRYSSDRIVTVEDTYELYCESASWLALHSTSAISQRTLMRSAMRARPDWLVAGEVRDSAAIDMIMSLSTHAGFCTVHGQTIAHGLTRTQQLCRLDGFDTVSPEMVGDAIDYGILMKRSPQGRYVADIAQVLGYANSAYQLQPIPVIGES